MATRYFTPQLFAFLRDLEAHNERDWFKANQERYEEHVREPALEFITDFAGPLKKISPHFVADARTVGGSLFRIQRDTRFSKDKTPYKTHTGMHFRHYLTRENVHAPGFYLHLEPGACYAGVGLWRPSTADANAIRSAIVAEPGRWKRVAHGARFREVYSLDGESLKRPPRGFDPDHPLLDDLRRKDFIAGTKLTQRQVTAGDFLEFYAGLCRRASPFMKFLAEAVGVDF
jgi:uncharacterized protein (TIGR02453 family)